MNVSLVLVNRDQWTDGLFHHSHLHMIEECRLSLQQLSDDGKLHKINLISCEEMSAIPSIIDK